MTTDPIEAECKFRVASFRELENRLRELESDFVGVEEHRDTYLRHPSRDFRTTDEALRIREVDGVPFITYKGPRLAGPIKIRPEIELPLVSDTVNGWMQIWGHLGFQVVATVEKRRTIYRTRVDDRLLTVTLDQVKEVGDYAEIERVVFSKADVDQAQSDILNLAKTLSLGDIERKSYLGLLIQKLALEPERIESK